MGSVSRLDHDVERYLRRGGERALPARCQCCGARDGLVWWGRYWRRLRTTTRTYRLPMRRIRCRSCGHAPGLPPAFIVPRRLYAPPLIETARALRARGRSWNAAVNGGVLVYTSFYPNVSRVGWHLYGGTSAASPQVAGLIALANAQQAAANEPPIGDVAPYLYSSHMGTSDFTDIEPVTQGTAASGALVDNTLWQFNADGSVSPGPVPGHPVRAGWDMATGFGSPIGVPFVADLRAARNAS
ncbi:MAG: DUF6431 domain-containing protein [Candidatus Limnocylindrales bacterium]